MIITDTKLLRLPCSDVLPHEVESIKSALEQELKNSNSIGKYGIGLASPQINIFKKMAIVRLNSTNIGHEINIDLVNPKIIASYDLQPFENEMCLSFPGMSVTTKRYMELVIENSVPPYKFIVCGLAAVVCAHEIEHFADERRLIIDHMPRAQPLKNNKKHDARKRK